MHNYAVRAQLPSSVGTN